MASLKVWDGSQWVNISGPTVADHGSLTGLGDNDHPQYQLSATNALSGLTDVSAMVPTTGQILIWDGTEWTASTNPAGVTDHGLLTGLADDDHTQYLLVDGTRDASANLTVSGDLTVGTDLYVSGDTTLSSVLFVSGPATTLAEGQVVWNDDKKTLDLQTGTSTTLQIGQELVIRVRNQTGTTMPNGTVAYVSGSLGSGAAKLLVASATQSTPEERQWLIGILTEEVANNSDGFLTTFGLVNDLDTSLYPVGTILYVDGAGLYTSAAPPAPDHKIQLGVVERQHATEGSIFVKPEPFGESTNLHDVVSTKPTTTGQVLVWDNGVGYYSPGDHGDLAGLADDDHPQYTLSATNLQLSTDVSNHIASSTVHFTEASIDHTAITNIGSNSHAAIDTHIADSTLHFTEGSVDHGSIAGLDDDDHPQYVLSATNNNLSSTVSNHVASGVVHQPHHFFFVATSATYTATGTGWEQVDVFDSNSAVSGYGTPGWSISSDGATIRGPGRGTYKFSAKIGVDKSDSGLGDVALRITEYTISHGALANSTGKGTCRGSNDGGCYTDLLYKTADTTPDFGLQARVSSTSITAATGEITLMIEYISDEFS